MLLNRALVKKDCADSLETFKGEAIFHKSNSLSITPYSSKKREERDDGMPQLIKFREMQIYSLHQR